MPVAQGALLALLGASGCSRASEQTITIAEGVLPASRVDTLIALGHAAVTSSTHAAGLSIERTAGALRLELDAEDPARLERLVAVWFSAIEAAQTSTLAAKRRRLEFDQRVSQHRLDRAVEAMTAMEARQPSIAEAARVHPYGVEQADFTRARLAVLDARRAGDVEGIRAAESQLRQLLAREQARPRSGGLIDTNLRAVREVQALENARQSGDAEAVARAMLALQQRRERRRRPVERYIRARELRALLPAQAAARRRAIERLRASEAESMARVRRAFVVSPRP